MVFIAFLELMVFILPYVPSRIGFFVLFFFFSQKKAGRPVLGAACDDFALHDSSKMVPRTIRFSNESSITCNIICKHNNSYY
jgi:hypothetical protein